MLFFLDSKSQVYSVAHDGYVYVWKSDTELSALETYEGDKVDVESEEEDNEEGSQSKTKKKKKAAKEKAKEDGK